VKSFRGGDAAPTGDICRRVQSITVGAYKRWLWVCALAANYEWVMPYFFVKAFRGGDAAPTGDICRRVQSITIGAYKR